jgi:hypothetical protein
VAVGTYVCAAVVRSCILHRAGVAPRLPAHVITHLNPLTYEVDALRAEGDRMSGCSYQLTGCPVVRQVVRFGTGSWVLVTA